VHNGGSPPPSGTTPRPCLRPCARPLSCDLPVRSAASVSATAAGWVCATQGRGQGSGVVPEGRCAGECGSAVQPRCVLQQRGGRVQGHGAGRGVAPEGPAEQGHAEAQCTLSACYNTLTSRGVKRAWERGRCISSLRMKGHHTHCISALLRPPSSFGCWKIDPPVGPAARLLLLPQSEQAMQANTCLTSRYGWLMRCRPAGLQFKSCDAAGFGCRVCHVSA
jgi:hypothetical protein